MALWQNTATEAVSGLASANLFATKPLKISLFARHSGPINS